MKKKTFNVFAIGTDSSCSEQRSTSNVECCIKLNVKRWTLDVGR
jgi:hypothetical protein